jgi:hypothetical protein
MKDMSGAERAISGANTTDHLRKERKRDIVSETDDPNRLCRDMKKPRPAAPVGVRIRRKR